MHIAYLKLRTFRNYSSQTLLFSPHSNHFYGLNAQGKSNLLEALYLLITGRSFRTQRLSELILQGEQSFEIQAEFAEQQIRHELAFQCDGSRKKILFNTAPVASFANLLGLVRGVLFTPQDHLLISGPPNIRRRFLDLHLVQLDPLYVHHLGRYHRALKQRNAALRSRQSSTLQPWEEQLASSAVYLHRQREQAVGELRQDLTSLASTLSQSHDRASLVMRHSVPHANLESYLQAWHQARSRELVVGHTLVGPHRDDLEITLQDKEARSHASEGQIRTLSLALRLAEWIRLSRYSVEPPLKLIDDFGVQLDGRRKAILLDVLNQPGQTFMTSPDPLPWPSERTLYQVSQGRCQLTH